MEKSSMKFSAIKSRNCSLTENSSSSIHVQQEAIPLAFLSVMVVGIFVLLINGGVFVILIKDKNIRKNPYLYLVLMLCASDFTVGLGIPFIGVMFFLPSLNGNKILTVMQVVLMTSGLCLSLLQTFLISFQRYLVLCKENWNLYIFQQNQKYSVCLGSSFLAVITNFVLVSPPRRNFDLNNENILSYVYHGHYLAHSIYIKFISLSLLSLTLIFYIVTVCYVLKNCQKVHPMSSSNSIHLNTIHVYASQASATVESVNDKTINDKDRGIPQSQIRRHLLSIRRKKVVSTLKLVGILIMCLIIFTGPFICSLWIDSRSAESNSLVTSLCVLNSFANPFIYLWRLYDVRSIIKPRLCFVRR